MSVPAHKQSFLKRSRWLPATVAALVALGATAFVAPSPVGAAAAATVSPASGLESGHPVAVRATGLTPSAITFVLQCGPTACQRPPSPPPSVFVSPTSTAGNSTPAGTLEAWLQVERVLQVDSETFDCATVACRVDVVQLSGGSPVVKASVPLNFAASGDYQWPTPTLTLSRTDGLIDGRPVEANGSGYDWWNLPAHWTLTATASVQICRAIASPTAADCETPERGFEALSGDDAVVVNGTLGDVWVWVRRHIELPSGPYDCAIHGCTLAFDQGGNPTSERVRIRFAPEWAPWPDADAFLTRGVEVAQGRPLGSAARADLRSRLGARSLTGVQALVDAAATSRHDATVGEIGRMYQAYFGRNVERDGMTYWLREMQRGTSALTLARTFGQTPEFRAHYAGLSDSAAVQLAYQRTLGRSANSDEVAYWVGRLEAGMTRADLVYSFARSPELRARTAPRAQALVLLWTLLGRTTDPRSGSPLTDPHSAARAVFAHR